MKDIKLAHTSTVGTDSTTPPTSVEPPQENHYCTISDSPNGSAMDTSNTQPSEQWQRSVENNPQAFSSSQEITTSAFEREIVDSETDPPSDTVFHRPEKPKYKCSLCSKEYVRQGSLQTHIRNLHSHDRPEKTKYKCDLCSKEYVYQGSLKTHIRKLHSFDQSFKIDDETRSESHISDNQADQDEKEGDEEEEYKEEEDEEEEEEEEEEEDDSFAQMSKMHDISSETWTSEVGHGSEHSHHQTQSARSSKQSHQSSTPHVIICKLINLKTGKICNQPISTKYGSLGWNRHQNSALHKPKGFRSGIFRTANFSDEVSDSSDDEAAL